MKYFVGRVEALFVQENLFIVSITLLMPCIVSIFIMIN